MGIANGLAVMADEGTRSLWDHITGEAFAGPLAGEHLPAWPITITTIGAAKTTHPQLRVLRPTGISLWQRFWRHVPFYGVHKTRRFPPGFRRSMATPIDDRLPAFEQGLGVTDGSHGRFYPFATLPRGSVIKDNWGGRPLVVERGATDGVPFARWLGVREPPMQLLTRWYGFSFTYPGCSIFARGAANPHAV